MKNILYFAIILSLVFASSCSKNKDDGTWTTSLGKARFATAQTWAISDGGITQVWSDAVEIIGAKGTYNSGNLTADFIDFRSNPGQKGSLFSWCAVVETANLCPPPWRVPTKDDFINLDKAMGGNGNNRSNSEFDTFVTPKYLGLWGGAFGGQCNYGGDLVNQGLKAFYWSQSVKDVDHGYNLQFNKNGNIYPQDWSGKGVGFALRCVRN